MPYDALCFFIVTCPVWAPRARSARAGVTRRHPRPRCSERSHSSRGTMLSRLVHKKEEIKKLPKTEVFDLPKRAVGVSSEITGLVWANSGRRRKWPFSGFVHGACPLTTPPLRNPNSSVVTRLRSAHPVCSVIVSVCSVIVSICSVIVSVCSVIVSAAVPPPGRPRRLVGELGDQRMQGG